MQQKVINKSELIPIGYCYDNGITSYNVWNKGYVPSERGVIEEDDIQIAKMITFREERVIKYGVWTLKPSSFIHQDLIKNAIHVLCLKDLPSYGRVPEGYYFFTDQPIIFDDWRYDAARYQQIQMTECKVIVKDKNDKQECPHWVLYIYFPPKHLYNESPAFVVDYSIIPLKEKDYPY